jgi:hypothetical protein
MGCAFSFGAEFQIPGAVERAGEAGSLRLRSGQALRCAVAGAPATVGKTRVDEAAKVKILTEGGTCEGRDPSTAWDRLADDPTPLRMTGAQDDKGSG